MITCFEIAGNSLVGHLSQWPAGLYHKAHYHGPGSVLFGLQSNGYVLLWSKDLGTRPYESGNGDGVVEMSWKDGSVYCPPGGWFHQHFNIGSEPPGNWRSDSAAEFIPPASPPPLNVTTKAC